MRVASKVIAIGTLWMGVSRSAPNGVNSNY